MWDDIRRLNAMALVVALAAVVTIGCGVVAWSVRQPLFALREVVVDRPLQRVNPAHFEAVVREELRGSFFTMRLADAATSLQRVPWVRHVALRRRWPNRLELTVNEHEPLARWNDNALVNTRGEVFTADYDGELPQFRGPEGSSGEIASRFGEFTQTLKATGLSIDETRLSARGGWQVKTSGASAITIELGRSDAVERLARLATFYPRTVGALARAGTGVDYADLRYRNGFAARIPGFKEKSKKDQAAKGQGTRAW